MLTMIIIIWLFLPVILIPMAINLNRHNSRLSAFLEELFRSGRISIEEYSTFRAEKSDTKQEKEEKPSPEAEKSEAEKTDSKPAVIYENNITEAYASRIENESFPSEQRRRSSVSVLFGIGTAFIILAGIIFGAAVWGYMSDIARTSIIGFAALVFFGASLSAMKKFRLEKTSSAFYILGTVFSVITFITAGIFGLFGNWLAASGEGCAALFSVSAAIAALFSAAAVKLYHKSSYTYFSLCCALISVILALVQISGEYAQFSFFITIFAAVSSGFYYYVKNKTGTEIIKPVTNMLILMRILFSCLAFPALIDWSVYSWTICSIWIAELTFYGTARKNKLMLSVQSILVLILSIRLMYKMGENMDSGILQLGFSFLMIALIVLYRFRKPLYTVCADIIFMTAVFINSLDMHTDFSCGLLSMLALEVLFFFTALDSGNVLNKFFRISLPVPLMIITYNTAGFINNKYDLYCYAHAFAVCAVLFIAVSAIFKLIKGKRFISMKYSFEIFSGIALIISAMAAVSDFILISLILLSIAAFAEIQTSGHNIHSVLPVFSFFISVSDLIGNMPDRKLAGNVSVIVSMIICAAFVFASRVMFRQKLHVCSGEKSHWDTLSAGVFLSVFLADGRSVMFSSEARLFIILAELAVFAANLYRRGHSRKFNSGALTASAALLSIALIKRPFMIIESEIISSKIVILIIAGFGFVSGKIWNHSKTFAANFSSAAYILAYALLLWDALINETLFNTLFVLCASLTILLYAFRKKIKRWFVCSASGLAGLTFYLTKDFLAEIDWWIYLLLVGILLVSIASANEYFKEKGRAFREKAGRFFEEWKW